MKRLGVGGIVLLGVIAFDIAPPRGVDVVYSEVGCSI
jgi:hypothetical protein